MTKHKQQNRSNMESDLFLPITALLSDIKLALYFDTEMMTLIPCTHVP